MAFFLIAAPSIAQTGHEGHDHPHPHPPKQSGPEAMGMTSANDPLEADVYFKPWRDAAEEYGKLLQKGPSLAAYVALGDLYMDEGFAHHAKFYYELAMSQQGDQAKAQEKLEKATERIDFLQQRFEMFQSKAVNEKDITGYGSMAAIRFHLGFHNEGMLILRQAVDMYGNDQRVYPLIDTFNQQLQNQYGALNVLHQEFKSSLVRDDKDRAIHLFGQIAFGSLGHPDSFAMLKEIKNVYPDVLNEESFQLYSEFVNQFSKS
jgi:tetratricopeptide (TPR) repeat protein